MSKTSAQAAVNLCYGQRAQLHLFLLSEAPGGLQGWDVVMNTPKLFHPHPTRQGRSSLLTAIVQAACLCPAGLVPCFTGVSSEGAA